MKNQRTYYTAFGYSDELSARENWRIATFLLKNYILPPREFLAHFPILEDWATELKTCKSLSYNSSIGSVAFEQWINTTVKSPTTPYDKAMVCCFILYNNETVDVYMLLDWFYDNPLLLIVILDQFELISNLTPMLFYIRPSLLSSVIQLADERKLAYDAQLARDISESARDGEAPFYTTELVKIDK